MKIIFTDSFKKKYKRLDSSIQNLFDEKLKILLVHGLSYPSLRIHKIEGKLNFVFSLSINMNFRALFYKKNEDNELKLIFYTIGDHNIYNKL